MVTVILGRPDRWFNRYQGINLETAPSKRPDILQNFFNIAKQAYDSGLVFVVFCQIFLAGALAIGTPCAADEQLVIGLMADTTGNSASNGQSCQKGFRLAQTILAPGGQIKGRTIKFIFEDNKGDPVVGVNAFSKFSSVDKVVAVVSTRAQVVMALNPLSKREHLPLLATIGHSDFVRQNPYAFNFWPTAEIEGRALARKAVADGFKRAAIVSTEDQWTLRLASAFYREFVQGETTVILQEVFLPTETDFRTAITKVRKLNPDLYFVNMVSSQAGTMIRALRGANQRQTVFSNLFGTFPEVINTAGKENVEGLIINSPDLNRPRFWDLMESLYPGEERPAATAYACYAALSMVLQAVHQNSGLVTKEEMLLELTKIRELSLLDEQLPIRSRQAEYKLDFKIVQNGLVKTLEPKQNQDSP